MTNILDILKQLLQGRVPPLHTVPAPLLDAVASVSSLRGKVSNLTSLERVVTAFRNKQPDHVPVTPILCSGARQIAGISFPDFALDAAKASQAFVDGFEFVGGDFVILLLDLSVEAADFGQNMIYPEESTPRPDYDNPIIKDPDDYMGITTIDFLQARRMQEFVKLCHLTVEKIGLRGIVSGFVFGPLGVLGMMRGAEAMFRDCLLYPKKVRKACETITEVLIEFVQAQCETGIGAIAIDTLFASRNGLSKALWEEIEGPFAREISKAITEKGIITGIHNCGHDPYFDAQIRSMAPGFISFAHLPDDCPTPSELKKRYGEQVSLVGHIPTPLLITGSPAQVMDACKKQIDDYAKDGGYVLAPGCEYPPNISLDNAFAMIRAAEQYG